MRPRDDILTLSNLKNYKVPDPFFTIKTKIFQ